MPMPFTDLRVLDLSHALAGPFATTMLADFGAEVIKIEPPGTGEISRAWGPPFYGSESAFFLHLNRNKKSVELDLKHPDGQALFFDLIARSDVVIENYRVGALAKLGIGYERACARHPGIIYCSISGFGQTGPYRDRAALDLILQAESGVISITGEEGGRGVRCGMSIADMTAGMYAAFGILTALRAREQSGRGQYIDVSMLDGQLGLLYWQIAQFFADGSVAQPTGTARKGLLPYQTLRTKTRDLAIAVGSDKLWQIFCPLVGIADLMNDPRYATNRARVANRPALLARLEAVFLTKTYEEWEAILLPAGIPIGAINTIDKVVEHPQVRAREMIVEQRHPVAGTVQTVGVPLKLSETPGAVRTAAPLLGQHTVDVLRETLGLDAARIAALRDAGVIGRPCQTAGPS
jgi:formyl-CoA transferase/CoA:oxalate CoA-transferase